MQEVITGRLRIGVVRSALQLLPLVEDVARFSAKHPHVEVSILQLPVTTTLQGVAGGDLDCGIVTAIPTTVRGVRLVPLAEESLVLVCRDDHPFANRSAVDVQDFEGQRFVDVQADWSARTMVDAALSAAGVTRVVAFEVNEWELLLDLVKSGAGVGLVPEGVARHAVDGTGSVLRSVPVAHPELRRHIQLVLPATAISPQRPRRSSRRPTSTTTSTMTLPQRPARSTRPPCRELNQLCCAADCLMLSAPVES